MEIVFNVAVVFAGAAVAAVVAHELGHYLVGKARGMSPKVTIAWRYVWDIPYPQPMVTFDEGSTHYDRRVFGVAGFALEAWVLWALTAAAYILEDITIGKTVSAYALVFFVHLTTYPFRHAGRTENDFRYLI